MTHDAPIVNLDLGEHHEAGRLGELEHSSNVHRLQPLRILLSGLDRRFTRVTSFLLTRRGYDVAEAPPSHVVDAAERHRADVVLLDCGASRAAAALKIAALQALATGPSVLIVVDGEAAQARWEGLPWIEKWMPIDTLADRIEAAASTREPPLPEMERTYQ
jgi:DNA-binding response OmpR family regulator